jgi:hypothetical protein
VHGFAQGALVFSEVIAGRKFIPVVAVAEFRVAVAAVDSEAAAVPAARQAAVAAAWRVVPRELEQVFLQGQAWEWVLGPGVQGLRRPLARGPWLWVRLSQRKSFSIRGKANARGAV